MNVLFPVVFMSYIRSSSSDDVDWCRPDLQCDGVNNTMCLYTEEKRNTGPCRNMEDFGLNVENRMYWLALHNTFRDNLASGSLPGWEPASNMKQLEWKTSLARQARRWVFQCKELGYDPCNKNPSFKRLPGQVFFKTGLDPGSKFDVKEEMKYNFLLLTENFDTLPVWQMDDYLRSISNKQVDEDFVLFLAQIMNANTSFIGGALLKFDYVGKKGETFSEFYTQTNYGESFNHPLYKIGRACSACPKGYSCKETSTYKNLCAQGKAPKDGEFIEGVPVVRRSGDGRIPIGRRAQLSSTLVLLLSANIL